MANMAKINKIIKSEFPHLDIEAVADRDYVYFSGFDGLGKIESICSHPRSTTTEHMASAALYEIRASIAALNK